MKYVIVDTAVIRANAERKRVGRLDLCQPAIKVGLVDEPGGKTLETQLGFEVEILGPCRVVQDDQLAPYGARVWIETDAEVVIR